MEAPMGRIRSHRKNPKKVRPRPAKVRKVLFEPLEPRILLSTDPLSYSAAAGAALDLTLRFDDTVEELQLIENVDQSVVESRRLEDIGEVVITGSTEDDVLTVDLDLEDLFETFTISYTDTTAGDSDSLKILHGDLTWNISGLNKGVVADIDFGGIENLIGGEGQDHFVFGAGAGISGRIDGGGGTNHLDYSGDQKHPGCDRWVWPGYAHRFRCRYDLAYRRSRFRPRSRYRVFQL
jgi:hypothetical protein